MFHRNIFDKIKVGFLMAGHAHEDADQIFSISAAHLAAPRIVCQGIPLFTEAMCQAFQQVEKFAWTLYDLTIDSTIKKSPRASSVSNLEAFQY